jgi:predicted PurR-regulated permease PerM
VVLVVQQIEGNVLQPLIVEHTLRLHPAAVLVAMTTGTLVWGLPGALLAVPLMAVTYRICEYLRRLSVPATVGGEDGRTAVPRTA